MIIYRYPQIVQPTILKYEPIPITDDEVIEKIYSTISSHQCLSSAKLYLNGNPLKTVDLSLIGTICRNQI